MKIPSAETVNARIRERQVADAKRAYVLQGELHKADAVNAKLREEADTAQVTLVIARARNAELLEALEGIERACKALARAAIVKARRDAT